MNLDRRAVLAIAAVAAVLVAFAFLLPTLDLRDTQFSAYGSEDDDASLLVNGLRQQGYEVASVTLGTTALDALDTDRVDAFYVAVGPDRGYPTTEASAVEGFVEAGGTAIVLDDTGASDALLERFGIAKGQPLISTVGNPSVVQVSIDDALVNMWEPVELEPPQGEGVTVLAQAHDETAKDASRTGQVDPEDPTCEDGCPVVVKVERGEGAFIAIADATFATNQYAGGSGVIPLVAGLASEEATGQRALVVVDESRHVAGVSEVGLTLFRVLMAPLGLPGVAYGLSALVILAGAASLVYREEASWSPHDPGFDDPYLEEVTEHEGGSG